MDETRIAIATAMLLLSCTNSIGSSTEALCIEGELCGWNLDESGTEPYDCGEGYCDGFHCVCPQSEPEEPRPPVEMSRPGTPDWQLKWGFAGSCGLDICVVGASFAEVWSDCDVNCGRRLLCGDDPDPHLRLMNDGWTDAIQRWLWCGHIPQGSHAYQCSCFPASEEDEPDPRPLDPGEIYVSTPGWCPAWTDLCMHGCSAEYAVCCCEDFGAGVFAAGQRHPERFGEEGEVVVMPGEIDDYDCEYIDDGNTAPEPTPLLQPRRTDCLGMPWDETERHAHDEGRHYHCVLDTLVWCEEGCCYETVPGGCGA